MSDHDIDVRAVVKAYDATTAVDDVSFTVERGKVLSLLGPSGCGKTTVMRMIAGLVEPDGGEIIIKGKAMNSVPVHRRNIGMLFQSYALFPHLDVAANVAFGLEMRGIARNDIRPRVEQALAMVKLASYAARLPHQLSGGQQQRVALARALVIEPSGLLLDEPFGALDKQLRESMQIETRQLQQRLGITTLMVTHDQEEALTLSDYVAVMRSGKIEQIATPAEIYERPATRFVAGFIGTANFISGQLQEKRADTYLVRSSDGIALEIPGMPPGRRDLTVAIRPESMQIAAEVEGASQANCTGGVVEQVIYRGLNTLIQVRRPNGEMITVIRQSNEPVPAGVHLAEGAKVMVKWPSPRNIVVAEDRA
jgi:putative spermidine/putrescine transport system ATP-binding protein